MITREEKFFMVRWIDSPGAHRVPPPASLDDLRGPPATDPPTLPSPICGPVAPWKVYRLDSRSDAIRWVETILANAVRMADYQDYLSADLLYRTWPALSLPPAVRERWETTHPELEQG
jgi:hypothetical protein